MRTRFEELMNDPCCASCDCDALSFDVAAYLDRKSCDAERCRQHAQSPQKQVSGGLRPSMRELHENRAQV